MNAHFLAHCADSYAYLPISSLDEAFEDEEGNVSFVVDNIPDPAPGIEEHLHQRQLRVALKRFVVELSPHLRCIVIRHYWFGQSQSEIAKYLGTTRSAVCHALRRVHKLGFRKLNLLA